MLDIYEMSAMNTQESRLRESLLYPGKDFWNNETSTVFEKDMAVIAAGFDVDDLFCADKSHAPAIRQQN